jgi:two-component system heavy metal sensor histidine kinase CusS
MLSRPSKPRSIATQLILLFTLAAALILTCALGGFYLLVLRHAFTEDNAVLTDKIRAVAAELQEPDGIRTLSQELQGHRAGEPTIYRVRILDPESHTIVETPRMKKVLPASVFAPPAEAASSVPKNFRFGEQLFSLVALTEWLDGRPYTIQIAQDRSEDDRFRTTFGALLLVTLALGTIAFAAIAVTVTREGLRPLREITTLLGRVSPSRLYERLDQRSWPREIQPLAVAFDNMLTRLEDAFIRLSQFSADLAHELRTPIGNMLGEAQVALTRARGTEEYREIIESSVAECERLAGIVDGLLFLARTEAADDQIQRSVFDGQVALVKIADFYEPIAEEQQLQIRCEGSGQIYADPMLFERALNNLVENALRYTPPGGSILISMTGRPNECEISVKDTGCGIAPEHLPHVFDRFYRADSSRSSQGTGLGLALVKSIVKLHGGMVSARSEKDRGTTVTLIFPNQPEPTMTTG